MPVFVVNEMVKDNGFHAGQLLTEKSIIGFPNDCKPVHCLAFDLLQLKNTGPALVTEPEALFERFKKEINGNEAVGLGLAIVKQICDMYQLKVTYHYGEGIHSLSLTTISPKTA